MNTITKIIALKEVKLIIERKKVYLLMIAAVAFPTIMLYVFQQYGSSLELNLSLLLMLFFVPIIASEFLYLSLSEEISNETLNVMFISDMTSINILLSKSIFPFILTAILFLLSMLIVQIGVFVQGVPGVEILSLNNIGIGILAIIGSIIIEWINLLKVESYTMNNHSLFMIVSYGISISIYFIQGVIGAVFAILLHLIIILLLFYFVLQLMKVKDLRKKYYYYFTKLFDVKKLTYNKLVIRLPISELRNHKKIYIKLLVPIVILFVPSIYPLLYKVPLNVFTTWILYFLAISQIINYSLFPAIATQKIYKIDILIQIARMRLFPTYMYQVVSSLLMYLGYLILVFVVNTILQNPISYTTYVILIISSIVCFLVTVLCASLIRTVKDYRIINYICLGICIIIHISSFGVMCLI